MVVDQLTGLMWTGDGNAPGPATCSPLSDVNRTWQGSLDYIACLNTWNYLGYSDWRLPNVNELESLVNAEQGNIAIWLNGQGFTNVQANWYWSSTSIAGYPNYAWTVEFWGGMYSDGGMGDGKTYIYYAWPVRGGQ